MDIRGKTVLVTGASRGIGREIALEFATAGVACVLLVARDRQRLLDVADEITARGAKAVPLVLDLSQTIAVNIAIAQAWRDHGPIDILVNCAGVAHQAPFLQLRLLQVQEEIATNLIGMYTITRLLAQRMVVQGGGTIINVASLMGKLALPTMATYSATKFAIVGFTQALRGELATKNIRVVALLPSLTDTEMVRHLRRVRGVIPLPPQQVAKTLVAGLTKGSNEILVGWQSHLAIWGNRLSPWLVERLIRLVVPSFERRTRFFTDML